MSKTCCTQGAHRTTELDQSLLRRLNRIEGQIRGIKGMIEGDVYCDDILTQVTAARSALDSVSKIILENHICSCIADQIQAGEMEPILRAVSAIPTTIFVNSEGNIVGPHIIGARDEAAYRTELDKILQR